MNEWTDHRSFKKKKNKNNNEQIPTELFKASSSMKVNRSLQNQVSDKPETFGQTTGPSFNLLFFLLIKKKKKIK